jgi:hypothetical protein
MFIFMFMFMFKFKFMQHRHGARTRIIGITYGHRKAAWAGIRRMHGHGHEDAAKT